MKHRGNKARGNFDSRGEDMMKRKEAARGAAKHGCICIHLTGRWYDQQSLLSLNFT